MANSIANTEMRLNLTQKLHEYDSILVQVLLTPPNKIEQKKYKIFSHKKKIVLT